MFKIRGRHPRYMTLAYVAETLDTKVSFLRKLCVEYGIELFDGNKRVKIGDISTLRQEVERKRQNARLWEKHVGSKVIVVTNEPEPIIIAEFVGYPDKGYPVYRDLNSDRVFSCGGMVFPYSERWEAFLNSIPDDERWDFLFSHHLFNDEMKDRRI